MENLLSFSAFFCRPALQQFWRQVFCSAGRLLLHFLSFMNAAVYSDIFYRLPFQVSAPGLQQFMLFRVFLH